MESPLGRADAEEEKHMVRGGKPKSLLGPELTVREDPFGEKPTSCQHLREKRGLTKVTWRGCCKAIHVQTLTNGW